MPERRKYRELGPGAKARALARRKLNLYVYYGKIKRQPCEVCGAMPTEAHHPDYSKPLDVEWLCPTHHREREKEKAMRIKPNEIRQAQRFAAEPADLHDETDVVAMYRQYLDRVEAQRRVRSPTASRAEPVAGALARSAAGKIATLAVLVLLVVPGVAEAKKTHHRPPAPGISMVEAQTAIRGYAAGQGGQINGCWRISRDRVACDVSIPCEITPGPVSITALATIEAFDIGDGPELERVGEWTFIETRA